MRVKIKICGISEEDNIKCCIDNSIDMIGFVFYENSPRNISILKAKNLLINIIKKKGLVLVYGDYDVDGVSSTAILVNFLNYIKNPNYYLIPNRFNDGYGPNLDLIKKNLKKNTKIVIFVDCGSNSTKIINFLKKNNIEVLIIDHHHINNNLSSTLNIINPMKNPKHYMGQNICAAALTLSLIHISEPTRLLSIWYGVVCV